MADETPPFTPKDALAFFTRKGLKAGFSWLDIQREEHDRWFTVAKMMQLSLLEETYQLVLEGLKEGRAPADTAKRLRELLVARGWWGKQLLTDPQTGQPELVQLGSKRRVDVIVRTNMRTAYASGRWDRIQRTKNAFPLLRYVSVKDGREREEHGAWHNTILPVDHEWWATHYPPCDWGCRCRAVALNERMMRRKGLAVTGKPPHFGTRTWTNKRTGEVRTIEKGIGAGWDYHPGKSVAGLAAEPMAAPFTEEEAAARDRQRFAHADRVFGLNAANGFSAIVKDPVGWPVAVSRRMLGDASALYVHRFVRLLSGAQDIHMVWLADAAGDVVLARRYIQNDLMLEISRTGWRIGRARTTGLRVWSQGEATADIDLGSRLPHIQGMQASYDPHQPRVPAGSPDGGQWTDGHWTLTQRMARASDVEELLDKEGIGYNLHASNSSSDRHGPSISTYFKLSGDRTIRVSDHAYTNSSWFDTSGMSAAEALIGLRRKLGLPPDLALEAVVKHAADALATERSAAKVSLESAYNSLKDRARAAVRDGTFRKARGEMKEVARQLGVSDDFGRFVKTLQKR